MAALVTPFLSISPLITLRGAINRFTLLAQGDLILLVPKICCSSGLEDYRSESSSPNTSSRTFSAPSVLAPAPL